MENFFWLDAHGKAMHALNRPLCFSSSPPSYLSHLPHTIVPCHLALSYFPSLSFPSSHCSLPLSHMLLLLLPSDNCHFTHYPFQINCDSFLHEVTPSSLIATLLITSTVTQPPLPSLNTQQFTILPNMLSCTINITNPHQPWLINITQLFWCHVLCLRYRCAHLTFIFCALSDCFIVLIMLNDNVIVVIISATFPLP